MTLTREHKIYATPVARIIACYTMLICIGVYFRNTVRDIYSNRKTPPQNAEDRNRVCNLHRHYAFGQTKNEDVQ
jgi:hypothetical protein